MGIVLLVKDEKVNRLLAVKFILKDKVNRQSISRFQREARALGTLHQQARFVVVHHFEDGSEGKIHLIMEYMPGGTLAEYLNTRGKPLTERQAAQLGFDLAHSMHFAHCSRLIHRDLKPGNILLMNLPSGDEAIDFKISDLGLVKVEDHDAKSLSQSNAVIGTLAYMSPEQAAGNDVTEATDVYSLGVILYECITGRLPYSGPFHPLLAKIISGEYIPLRQIAPLLSSDFTTIIEGCLQKELTGKNARYGSMNELKEDLRRFLNDQPILRTPPTAIDHALRYVRKNSRLVATILLTILTAMVAGFSLMKWQQTWVDKQKYEVNAEQDRKKALKASRLQRYLDLEKMTHFVVEDLLAQQKQITPDQRQFLLERIHDYDMLAHEADPNDHDEQLGLANGYNRQALIHEKLGSVAPAQDAIRKALGIYQKLESTIAGEANTTFREKYAACMVDNSVIVYSRDEKPTDQAVTEMESCLSKIESWLDKTDKQSKVHESYLRLLQNIAHLQKLAGMKNQGVLLERRAYQLAKKGLHEQPLHPDRTQEVIKHGTQLFSGLLQLNTKEALAEALSLSKELEPLITLQLVMSGKDSQVLDEQLKFFSSSSNMAHQFGDIDRAINLNEQAIKIAEKLKQQFPSMAWRRLSLSGLIVNHANFLIIKRSSSQVIENLLQRADTELKELLKQDPGNRQAKIFYLNYRYLRSYFLMEKATTTHDDKKCIEDDLTALIAHHPDKQVKAESECNLALHLTVHACDYVGAFKLIDSAMKENGKHSPSLFKTGCVYSRYAQAPNLPADETNKRISTSIAYLQRAFDCGERNKSYYLSSSHLKGIMKHPLYIEFLQKNFPDSAKSNVQW